MSSEGRDHWRHFAEFCRWELASGGPDPQLEMVRAMAAGSESPEEMAWRDLCYIAVYNVPFGEALWRELPWAEARDAGPAALAERVADLFARELIVTRVERRCVRRADWMTEYLLGARELAGDVGALTRAVAAAPSPRDGYEVAWTRLMAAPRIGRYVAIKLIELMRRQGLLAVETPDIRPRSAWSPRETLETLWSDHDVAARDDRPQTLDLVRRLCDETVARLRTEWSVESDLFQLQVLLCEYRESWEGRKQYPGRSLDSELGYAQKAEEAWALPSDMWVARRALFPHRHLGELSGWDGPRKDVAVCLADLHYTWSDLMYDYQASRQDMRRPVAWA